MPKSVYICTGGCGAKISEEEYHKGLKTCGTSDCPHHGQPFVKMLVCDTCGELYAHGEEHQH